MTEECTKVFGRRRAAGLGDPCPLASTHIAGTLQVAYLLLYNARLHPEVCRSGRRISRASRELATWAAYKREERTLR